MIPDRGQQEIEPKVKDHSGKQADWQIGQHVCAEKQDGRHHKGKAKPRRNADKPDPPCQQCLGQDMKTA